MQVPNGLILDRFGLRLFPLYVLTFLIGLTLIITYPAISTLFVGRLLMGAGASFAFASAIYTATTIFSERWQAFFIALVTAFGSFGSIIATNIAKEVTVAIGIVEAQIILFCEITLLLLVVTLVCKSYYRNFTERVFQTRTPLRCRLREIFANRNNWALFCYSFFTWFVATSFAGYWAKDYFMIMHDYTADEALALMQNYWLSYLIGSLVVNMCMRHKSFYIPTLRMIAFTHFAVFLFLIIPVVYSQSVCQLIIILAGVTTAGSSISYAILNNQVSHESVGIVVALNNTCMVFGGMAGSYIFGAFVTLYNQQPFGIASNIVENYYIALLTLPVAAFLAFLPLFTLLRKKRMNL